MKNPVTGILVTSVALAMLIGTEGAYAEAPPVIVSGTDQGGDLGVHAFYFKVEPYSIVTGH
jgi:hypothetical protein